MYCCVSETFCAAREVQYVRDIGLMMEELGLQPLGALDQPDVLPALREAATYVDAYGTHQSMQGTISIYVAFCTTDMQIL